MDATLWNKYMIKEKTALVLFHLCKTVTYSSDNVDTRSAMDSIRELVSAGNTYISSSRKTQRTPNRALLLNIATYITDLLKVSLCSRAHWRWFAAAVMIL